MLNYNSNVRKQSSDVHRSKKKGSPPDELDEQGESQKFN